VVAALVEAGADVNAPFVGAHAETPLHWAASSDDVEVLDALVDAGADVEAPGAVLGGGTPLADAVGFGQWRAAAGWSSGVPGRRCGRRPRSASWTVSRSGQRRTAEYLRDRGADLNWVGWNEQTPLDIAVAQDAGEVAEWLRSQGARSAAELR
jgi:ankyrin repeat protein